MVDKFISMLTCVDNRAIVFNLRRELYIGCKIVCVIMAKWGFTVHVGNNRKKSNTEMMVFPLTIKLKEWR